MTTDLRVFGDHEPDVLAQLERCAAAAEGTRGVLCADGHLGYSQPIGGVVAYPHHISPSGVGYDIACGNKAVKTNMTVEDLGSDVSSITDEIVRRISFGMGRSNLEPVVEHEVLDAIRDADFAPQRQLYDLAANQLGTVGAGNHYVDLFADERDTIWIGVHFGSRGFGHKTANGFLALAQGKRFEDHGAEGEMRSPPVLLDTESELGQSYIAAMTLAGRYAYAGRDWVAARVLKVLGAESDYEVHNHHNFAWRETHFGHEFWVVRKGATPAFPGQRGFVGSTMGDESVILEGLDSEQSRGALYSTVHGAGRVMSRTEAAGKMRTVWECTERNCAFHVTTGEYRVEREKRAVAQHERFTMCPDHPGGRMRKQRRRVRDGKVDWSKVTTEIRAAGIELRGGAADEAPEVYKDLREVLAAHGETVRVVARLRPLAVVMAGADVFDAFKD